MRKLFLLAPVCLLLFTATFALAQSRRQPFRFQLTPVDAKTLQPRSTFVLGEAVVVRFSLTNQSRVARKIAVLPDTTISYKLHSTELYENDPDVFEGYVGGTGWARTEGNMTVWGSYPPRMMTLAPGQTVSRTFELTGRYGYPIDEGTHTLTANYNEDVQDTTSFRVIVDEEKTVPLLEQLAAMPSQNGRDTVQRWAKITLDLVRKPSISGRITDSEGRPLNEISIYITGALDTNTETRKNGRYIIELLRPGSTYTITPQIQYYHRPGDSEYTLEPASRTITVQNGKITVNFVATRIRVAKNYAAEDEGAKAKVSSIRDWMFEPEHAIDGYRIVSVGERKPDYWNDGTPNQFPDWMEVDFGVTRRIDWINVFTLPDNLNDPPDPDRNKKFSLYGITDFDVEYWTGRAWRTVPGGAIRNNRNVWRMISFPDELVTNKIRVVVLNALGGESRITEIEAVHLNKLPEAKLTVEGQGNAAKTAKGHTDAPLYFLIDGLDRDGRIQHYELDFDDGSQNYEWTRNSQKPGDKPQRRHSHVFTKPGTYDVTLTVVDDSEEATETTVVVTITYPPERKAKAKQTSHR